MDALRDGGGRDRADSSPPELTGCVPVLHGGACPRAGGGSGQGTGGWLISPLLHLLQKLLRLYLIKGQLNLGYQFRLLLLEWAPTKLHKWLWHPEGSELTQEQDFCCRHAQSLELQELQPATSVSVSSEALVLFGAVHALRAEEGDCLTASLCQGQGCSKWATAAASGSCNWVFWGDQHTDNQWYWLQVQCQPRMTWQHRSRFTEPS